VLEDYHGKIFKNLMGMYELLGRRLDFKEKERDDCAKIVDHKLEWMHARMEHRLIHMETKLLLLRTL